MSSRNTAAMALPMEAGGQWLCTGAGKCCVQAEQVTGNHGMPQGRERPGPGARYLRDLEISSGRAVSLNSSHPPVVAPVETAPGSVGFFPAAARLPFNPVRRFAVRATAVYSPVDGLPASCLSSRERLRSRRSGVTRRRPVPWPGAGNTCRLLSSVRGPVNNVPLTTMWVVPVRVAVRSLSLTWRQSHAGQARSCLDGGHSVAKGADGPGVSSRRSPAR